MNASGRRLHVVFANATASHSQLALHHIAAKSNRLFLSNVVPARHVSEGAAPCPYCLAPCPNSLAPCPIHSTLPELNFGVFRQLMNCIKLLANLCPCFHRSLTKLCPDLVSFACWTVPEFWAFERKSMSDLVVHALNCPIFCHMHTTTGFSMTRIKCCQHLNIPTEH